MTEGVKKRLSEIRGRAEKATPGPWETRFIFRMWSAVRLHSNVLGLMFQPKDNDWADSDLTAHARTDIPALLDLVQVLLEERGAWNEYGDKGVGPYVEAADTALARFGGEEGE